MRLGKRRRRRTWKVIGHWSDPPPPEPAPPAPKTWTEGDKKGAAAAVVVLLVYGPRLLAFFASPVLVPVIAGINTDYLAEGFALGMAMIGIGAMLLGFVRRHNRAALRSDAATITLMGPRLPRAIMSSGLLTAAPCVLLWLFVGRYSWVIWFAFSMLAFLGIAGFASLIRQQGVIAVDAFGIRFRDLWASALPWSNIADIRIESEPTVDWLVIDLKAPLPPSAGPGSLFAVRTRINEARTAIYIDWHAYQADPEDLLAFLRRRLDDHRAWAAARAAAPHAVDGPDGSARALRDMDPALADE
jgi:hypothetical protein